MVQKRKIDEVISPLGGSLKELVRQQTARHSRAGDVRDADRALRIAGVAKSLPARMWQDPEKVWYVSATPEFQFSLLVSSPARRAHRNPSRLGRSSSSSPQPFSSSCDRTAEERRADGPWSILRLAIKRQPSISKRLLPALTILVNDKISPGVMEFVRDPQLHYGIRSASSLDEAQARFVPVDFLPGSAYSQGMQGAYVTGTAVSTAVVREAVDLMSKKEVARTDAQTSDRRFTNAVTTFVEGPGKGQPFVVIPYTGLGTQGKSGISRRLDKKFGSEQLIGRFWRTCAFIASQKPGGMEAHIRITNVAMFSRPVIDALFLHAGTGYDTVLEFEHDIEALVGGAFVGGRSSDGGLNVAELGSGVLDHGAFSRGFGPQAYAIMDTLAVRSRVPREQVEKRPAYKVFESYPGFCDKLRDLHGVLNEKSTTQQVLARADAKTHRDRIPTLKQLSAGEFGRWLNAAGGRGSAAEYERLFAVSLF